MSQIRSIKSKNIQLPIFVEKDEKDFYVAECPVLEGCYSQGKTIDEALKNIKEVVSLVMEEKENHENAQALQFRELSLHTIAV